MSENKTKQVTKINELLMSLDVSSTKFSIPTLQQMLVYPSGELINLNWDCHKVKDNDDNALNGNCEIIAARYGGEGNCRGRLCRRQSKSCSSKMVKTGKPNCYVLKTKQTRWNQGKHLLGQTLHNVEYVRQYDATYNLRSTFFLRKLQSSFLWEPCWYFKFFTAPTLSIVFTNCCLWFNKCFFFSVAILGPIEDK